MAGQNPFVYQPGLHERAMQRDPREGFWGRSFRPQEDIELPAEGTTMTPAESFMFQIPRPAGRSGGAPGGDLSDEAMAASMPPIPGKAPHMGGGFRRGGLLPQQEGAGIPPPDMASLNPVPLAGGYAGRQPGRMEWDMSGGSPEQTSGALAGLAKAQSEQFSPFSEFELSALANRDPNTVAPGSNQVWQKRLSDMQANRGLAEKFDRQQAEIPQAANVQLHPDVQEAQAAEAEAKAFPQMVAGRSAIDAAKIRAQGQIGAANAMAASRYQGDQISSMDPIMQAIRALKAKNNFTSADAQVLQGLMRAYHDRAESLGMTGFEELTEE